MQALFAGILSSRKRHKGKWLLVGWLGTMVSVLAGALAYSGGHAGIELIAAVFSLAILMFCYFAFLMTSFANDLWLVNHRNKIGWIVPTVFVSLVYLFFSIGTGTFAWQSMATISMFALLPSICVKFSNGNSPRLLDWLAVTLIWLPFDLGLLTKVWLWPVGSGAYILNTAVAVCLAIFLFSSQRRISAIGFRLQWQRGDLATCLLYFSGFCAVAIPFGFFTGFIDFNVRPDLVKGLLAPAGIFLFIAYPEELLFRGLLQNFIRQKFNSDKLALILAAIIFGATHLNNGPAPDWRYFVLATIAGLVYGAAYFKTENLFVPAVIHALVDSVWMQFLMKNV